MTGTDFPEYESGCRVCGILLVTIMLDNETFMDLWLMIVIVLVLRQEKQKLKVT